MLNSNFKEIEGYEGKYFINEYGMIHNGEKFMATYRINSGYDCIDLRDYQGNKRKWLVHRLVALNFLPTVEGKNVVNHIDGVKTNNHVDNLEWVTLQENLEHARENGLWEYNRPTKGLKMGNTSKYRYVGWDKARGRWTAGIRLDGRTRFSKRFDCEKEAARYVNHLIIKYGVDVELNEIT